MFEYFLNFLNISYTLSLFGAPDVGPRLCFEVADEESTKTTGVRFTGKAEVFGDSTWFRRYNAFDTSSWSPEIPVDYQKVETPLQRWHEAVRQLT